MWILNFPASYPTFFVVLALVWSVIQAWAGWLYGYYIFDANRPNDLKKKVVRRVYGFHHGALYFVCSISGFAAWGLIDSILRGISNWSGVTAGTVSVILGLTALSVLGISGALSRLLYLGNLSLKGNVL
jgi:hypothetical protein